MNDRLSKLLGVLLGLPLLLGCSVAVAAEPKGLSLEQAIGIALVHNADARLASLAVASAGAATQIAAAQPNPTLTLQSFNINPRLGVGSGSLREKTVDSAARLDLLVERGGKRAFRMAAASKLESAARSDQQDTRRQLRMLVSNAYYEWMGARARLGIANDNAELFDGTVAAARKRQQAGDLAPADTARAEVDALRARNDALQAKSDLFAARQAVLVLMGEEDGAQWQPGADWPDAPPPALAAGANAMGRRPDVSAAQARVDAAQASRKLALAQRSADLTIGIQAEHYPVSAANSQGSGNSYGIALQVPLMLRYANEGEIRAAAVALDAAAENLEKIRQQARSELLVSAEQAGAAHERMQRCEQQLLPAARKAADAAEYAFRRGALGIMDLLDVRRSYRAAQLDALAARIDYAKSLAAWQAAVSEDQPL